MRSDDPNRETKRGCPNDPRHRCRHRHRKHKRDTGAQESDQQALCHDAESDRPPPRADRAHDGIFARSLHDGSGHRARESEHADYSNQDRHDDKHEAEDEHVPAERAPECRQGNCDRRPDATSVERFFDRPNSARTVVSSAPSAIRRSPS